MGRSKYLYDPRRAEAHEAAGYWIARQKRKLIALLMWLGAAILINTSVTSAIYAFKHPKKTDTERFLHIPKSFIYNFK